MVYSIVEYFDLIADANFHRNDYEPMEYFASCAVWREVHEDQLLALLKYQWSFCLLFHLQSGHWIFVEK